MQETYRWLLAHYCLHCLIFQTANLKNISPSGLSFIGTLRVIQSAVPEFQCQIHTLIYIKWNYSWLIAEISDVETPLRQQRSNPKVVKKARYKFKTEKCRQRNNCTPR
ncbi:hypothetical protein [Trichormus azollae]|uniref:hypothetical protein n=1 Tax=Trichormus azollae TaxID=1164 RepID=UPI003D335EB3